jgi:AcrR family transcriptional regulator
VTPRDRIREAMLDLFVANGVEATSVEMVVERAAVDRAEFDRLFAGKDDLYLQFFYELTAAFEHDLFAAYEAQESWRDGLRAAAYYAACYFRDRPRETAFGTVQMFAAGEVAQGHRERQLYRMVELIDRGREELEDPDSMSRGVAESVFGSVYELLLAKLRAGEGTASALDFVPDLMYVAVRSYLGHEVALEELSISAPPEACIT